MVHPSRHITDVYAIDRLASWATLGYVTAVLLIPLAGVDLYLTENSLSSGQVTGAKLAVYSAPLGLFSIFLGALFWDAMRTGGVTVIGIYRRVSYIVVPFGLVTVLALAFLFHPTAYWGEHELQSRLLIFRPLFNFMILFFAVSLAAIPTVIRHYRAIFILCLVSLTVSILWEILFFVKSSSLYEGRASGFTGNPNIAGELLVALSIASVDWSKPRRLNAIIWIICGIAILPTFSRGGIVEYVFALGAYLAFTVRPRPKTLLRFTALAFFCAFIFFLGQAVIGSFLESNEFFSDFNAQKRISLLTTIAEGDFTSAIEDHAAQERGQLAYDAFKLIGQSPTLGYGTNFAYAKSLGPHNVYLNQWLENGILGLGLLLVFLLASLWHFKIYKDVRGMMFVATFFIAGFFSHNLLDQRPFMVMFGLLGALAYTEYAKGGVSRSSSPKA